MSLNLKDPCTRDEVEVVLKAKIEAGEAETGLYETDLAYVVVDLVDDKVTFQWFGGTMLLADVLD